MYGRANDNGREAASLYREWFPNTQQPYYRIFASVYRRMCETGSVLPSNVDRGRPRYVRTPAQEERVLQHMENDPRLST